jgi:hypothetical protein
MRRWSTKMASRSDPVGGGTGGTAITPGPWHVSGGTVNGPDGTLVCGIPDPQNTPKRQANARLISAAPDLLDAIDELLVWCADQSGPMPTKKASAAYAKATGLTPEAQYASREAIEGMALYAEENDRERGR